MYDDDVFNFLNSSTTTETEKETENQTYAQPRSYSSPENFTQDSYNYDDDYTVAQNFKEETNYQSNRNVVDGEQTEQKVYKTINAPIIQKTEKEETVTLTKTRQVIKLTGRMKIVFSMFLVILVSLIATIAWNFASAGRINASLDEKQLKIQELQLSIRDLTDEYNLLGDDGNLKILAEDAGFVDANDSNTVVITLDEMYVKEAVQEVPSNWFNDVCDFFSRIFA